MIMICIWVKKGKMTMVQKMIRTSSYDLDEDDNGEDDDKNDDN